MPAPKMIIVAEDDMDLTRVLNRFLVKSGYRVCTAANNKEFVSVFHKNPVDGVLLDINLDRDNGWETLRMLREHSQVPVILMTGASVDHEVFRDAELLGAQELLQKPFSYDFLVRRLRQLIP